MHRAYSVLNVKSVETDRRIIRGTATTPSPDRIGDIVEPKGVSYKNPLPLLLYHDTTRPVGTVTFEKPTADGIEFTAEFPEITEPGPLRDRVQEAWLSVTHRLLAGVSIGFRPFWEAVEQLKTGGIRFLKTEVVELSLVTVPANAEAVIHTIKSLDAPHLAASGLGARGVTPHLSGVSDLPRKDARLMTRKTYAERITAFEAERQAKAARLGAIQDAAGDEGRSKDESEQEEFKTLKTEIASIDAELKDLRDLEALNITAAKPVNGSSPQAGSESRGANVITLKPTVEKGTAFTRFAMALAAGRGSRLEALEYAKRWEGSTPEVMHVLKAAMAAGTTTDSDWAAPLVVYQNMASEFVELLRPATIIGRIPGLRRVPFNISMPTQTQGATAGWVGQGAPKPVSELKFGSISLGMAKAAGIIVLSEELVRSSAPSAEAIVRADLIATIGQFLDVQFVDPSVAAVANVSPASITNGITVVDSTGTTATHFQADVKTLFATFTAANLSVAGSVWLMTETQAQALAMIQNALGQNAYPSITMTGGTLFGLPVVTSENIPKEGGSPSGSRIILVKASEILYADDGGVTLDVSREASLQMNSTPDSPATASTVYVSLWQNNLVGLRAERYTNWVRRRDAAVGIIEGAVYVG